MQILIAKAQTEPPTPSDVELGIQIGGSFIGYTVVEYNAAATVLVDDVVAEHYKFINHNNQIRLLDTSTSSLKTVYVNSTATILVPTFHFTEDATLICL